MKLPPIITDLTVGLKANQCPSLHWLTNRHVTNSNSLPRVSNPTA